MHINKFLIIQITCFVTSVFAQQNLPTTSVNVFKNGTYFVVKEGKINAPNSKTEILVAGSPLLGTYWFTTTKEYKINKAVFVTDTVKRNREARSLQELLQANSGKKVRVSYQKSEKEIGTFSGTLQSLGNQVDLVKIKAPNNQTLYIAGSKITEFIVEDNAQDRFDADSLARVATLHFNKPLNAAPLKLSYINKGINWIPSYNIKILNDKQLQLELKALVENFAEDIQGAELTVTVGAPHFRFGHAIDPLAINTLSTENFTLSDGRVSTHKFQNVAPMATRSVAMEAANDVPEYAEYLEFDTKGQKSNDLFFYQLGKVDIPKNSKVSLPIFSSNINYEDLYEVIVNDYVAYASNRQIYNTSEQKFDVHHILRLTNNYTTPLTTAPVFIQDENLNPLAQDQLNYTPVGGKVKIQLAKSPDIVVGNTEEEIDKVERARKVNNAFYSRVTIRGIIKIENLQNKAIQLNTTKRINGTITKASDGGKIQKPGKYSGVNAQTSAEWELKIGPGETRTINYEYEVFVYP